MTDLARVRALARDFVGAYEVGLQAIEHGNTEAMRVAGRVAEGSGLDSTLDEMAQKARDHDHVDPDTGMFSAHFYKGNEDVARTFYERAARHGDVESMWRLARLLELAKLSDDARFWYHKAAEGESTEALRGLGRLAEDGGDSAGAASYYRSAVERDDRQALEDLTMLYIKIGDYVQALDVARTAAALGRVMPLYELAGAHKRAGDIDTALLRYHEALDHATTDTHRTFVANALVALAIQQADYDHAIALYAPLVDAGDVYGRFCLFQLYITMDDLIAATALAQKAATSGDFSLVVRLAYERGNAGHIEEELTLLHQAAAVGDYLALTNLAVHHDRTGDHATARHVSLSSKQRRRGGATTQGWTQSHTWHTCATKQVTTSAPHCYCGWPAITATVAHCSTWRDCASTRAIQQEQSGGLGSSQPRHPDAVELLASMTARQTPKTSASSCSDTG